MRFDSIFSFSKNIAGDAQGVSRSLGDKIPGADTDAKILREESYEAVAVMGFINEFMGGMQNTAQAHSESFNDPKTTSGTAASTMKEGSKTVDDDPDIEKPSQDTKSKGNKN